MIGRVLGNFRIVSLLGRGGMGEVWKAEQITLAHRAAAIKVIAPNVADPVQAIERLQREGAIAASVKHAGIAGILDAGVTDGVHWIALEFVDGETLAERLKRGPLELREACRVARELADALMHAHSRGVLHRDIKPGNIMIEPDGHVVLLDFGLALSEGRSRLTPDGVLVGTPQYLAPEVLKGHKADARSDVYALGVVFYECLTGAPPFKSERAEGAFHAPMHENPEPPSKRRAGLSPEWDALTMRALAREPGLRVPSAREFALAAARLMDAPPAGDYVQADSHATTGSMSATTPPPSRLKRLAVLPFHEMSGAPDGEAFADGFAEVLSGALARYPGIEVMPPSSTRHLAREGAGSMARELAADHVLSGTVQRAGERLRVTCSLVDCSQGTTAYSDTFEGTRDQLFVLEEQLVRALASALRLAPPSPQPDRQTPDPVAHERLLQARGYLLRFDNEASVDGAIKLLEPMAHEGGASASVWAELGRAYRQKYPHTMERVWLERALHACRQALALEGQHTVALACMAAVLSMMGRPEEAEKEYRAALLSQPDHSTALSGLVALLRKQGRLAEAEETARRAVALKPLDWVLHNLHGVVLFDLGRYEEAIESWCHVRRLVPDNARAVYNMAAAYFELGRLDHAERHYLESLELQRSPTAFTGLGTVLFFQQRYPEAEAAFEKSIGLRPRDSKAWGNLAGARRWIPQREDRVREDYRQAIRLAREQLETDPSARAVRVDLAHWLTCCGEFEEALALVKQALRENPDDAYALGIAVTVYEVSGFRAQALEALARAASAGHRRIYFDRDLDLVRLRECEEYSLIWTRAAVPQLKVTVPILSEYRQGGES